MDRISLLRKRTVSLLLTVILAAFSAADFAAYAQIERLEDPSMRNRSRFEKLDQLFIYPFGIKEPLWKVTKKQMLAAMKREAGPSTYTFVNESTTFFNNSEWEGSIAGVPITLFYVSMSDSNVQVSYNIVTDDGPSSEVAKIKNWLERLNLVDAGWEDCIRSYTYENGTLMLERTEEGEYQLSFVRLY